MQVSDFSYELPKQLIARYPLKYRTDSRLLRLDGDTGGWEDGHFTDIQDLLNPGDLLVFNDTRVVRARLFATKETGGRVEILIERVLQPRQALAHVRTSKSPRVGAVVLIEGIKLEVTGREADLFELSLVDDIDFWSLMDRYGHMPLPPYIDRADGVIDQERYQTVYGQRSGAVAAPTAGLHFDLPMLESLGHLGVTMAKITLHVGAGTFQPVRASRLEDHVMHSEYLEIDEKVVEQVARTRIEGGRVVAVGTTSVRSLETASQGGELRPFTGETRLFVYPGYKFNCVDAMLTNFHLPGSTLLMLVCAFAGYRHTMAAYRHAVADKYRFFSYGDAMFVTRRER